MAVLRWIDHGGLEKKLKGLAKRTDVFLQSLIDEVRNKEEEGNNLIDHLLNYQRAYDGKCYTALIYLFILTHTTSPSKQK